MNGQPSGNQPTNAPQANPALPPPPQPAKAKGNTSQTSQNPPDNDKATANELAREVRWIEIASIVVNFGLAIIGIVALCIYSGQLEVMRRTLDTMKSSGDTTTRQTWQAIGNMNWLAREMNYARDQATVSSKASEASTKAALDASIKASRIDQRAWVGAIGVGSPQLIDGHGTVFMKEGEIAKFDLIIKNTGKTPARKVKPSLFYEVLAPDVTFSPQAFIPPSASQRTVVVLQPSMPFELTVTVRTKDDLADERITKHDLDTLKMGKMRFYLHGRLEYEDIFGVSHFTTYCFYMSASLDEFTGCSTYNDAN
jgi:hypothetical protein